jgi:predicted RNase H-like nuclease (RuvC/YqgF family)
MKKQANFKLPEELIAALQDRAVQERTTATELVIQALNSFLGNPETEDLGIDININNIAECVEDLKERLDKLESCKNFYFMYNSPSCEANDIDIRIDSDSVIPKSEEELTLAKTVEKLELENENLQERVAALEALIHEYRYQSLPQSIERQLKS